MTETHTVEHSGFTIEFDPATFKFRILEEPLANQYARYASLDSAKETINEHVVKLSAERRAAATLKLPVVSDTGAVTEIRGIHASQGYALTTDKIQHRDLYVDRPWVREAVKEEILLTAGLRKVQTKLSAARVQVPGRYGRKGVDAYVKNVEELAKNYEETAAKLDAAK